MRFFRQAVLKDHGSSGADSQSVLFRERFRVCEQRHLVKRDGVSVRGDRFERNQERSNPAGLKDHGSSGADSRLSLFRLCARVCEQGHLVKKDEISVREDRFGGKQECSNPAGLKDHGSSGADSRLSLFRLCARVCEQRHLVKRDGVSVRGDRFGRNQEGGSRAVGYRLKKILPAISAVFLSLPGHSEEGGANPIPQPPVTDYAEKLDTLYHFLVGISALACVLVILAFVYFVIRYRRKGESETGSAKTFHSSLLEFSWSFIPFVIFAVAFVWGWVLYYDLKRPPKNSLEVHVYGQMWNWTFVYKNGRKTVNEFRVPVNRPVKLIMTSKDVLHSFFIPSFRVKQDVVPGIYTSLWFQANRKGKFHVFCAEFCGTGHSKMLARVHVVSLKEWEDWLANDPFKGLTLAEIGKKTFQGRCDVCHSVAGDKRIGPGLAGLMGAKREFTDGKSLTADESYLRESILNPSAKIVSGFANQMTPFAGTLSEEELTGLIEYIKTLK